MSVGLNWPFGFAARLRATIWAIFVIGVAPIAEKLVTTHPASMRRTNCCLPSAELLPPGCEIQNIILKEDKMGDRANVQILDEEEHSTFLYTHWDGYKLLETVQAALERGRGRWHDPQYLARIIFCEMVQSDVMGLTGYGISAQIGDGGDQIVVVDPPRQEVRILMQSWTFKEFCDLKKPKWKGG